MQSIHSVLFVCTANICRSPMGMGLLRARVKEEADQWRIDSSGIWAQPGIAPAQNTILILRTRGIELDNYVSKPLTVEMMHEFNLILTMERNHQEAVRMAFPQYTGKVFMLSQMINRKYDVLDPIGGPLADFEDTAQTIEQIINKGYARIRKLAAGGKTASLS